MSDIILHHYPPSPVAEKMRLALGIKGLSWNSVEENRLPDRPELFAMTGGYRRIPVMQVGADIYCDTQCIFRALEERYPEPSLFANGVKGLPFGLSRWTDAELFQSTFRIAFAPVMDQLPEALVKDRARLYLGEGGDLAKEANDMPHTLAQYRAQLGWLEDTLASGRDFLLGDKPDLADVVVWFDYWLVQERYPDAASFHAEFTHLQAWEKRLRAIGHGTSTDMSCADSLAIAKEATPTTAEKEDALDPQGLKVGMKVGVAPTTDSAEKTISGTLRAVDRYTVAITVESVECGETAVHFPRVGYRVTIQD